MPEKQHFQFFSATAALFKNWKRPNLLYILMLTIICKKTV